MNRFLIWLAGLSFLSGCIEPLESVEFEQATYYVVEALITNDESPQQIRLSQSVPVDSFYLNPVSGASVRIEMESGTQYAVAEVRPGVYETDTSIFKPQVGDRLRLLVSHDEELVSEFVTINPATSIEDVNWTVERKTFNEEVGPEFGVEISVTSETSNKEIEYFLWDYTYTYEIITPGISNWVYDESAGEAVPRENPLSINRCWANVRSNEFFTENTINTVNNQVVRKPLVFIPFRLRELAVRFSIEVRQFSLTRDAYVFYNNLREVNSGQGTLFDPQPGEVLGNLRNLSNPARPVLGYFDASQVHKQRIFIDGSELPPNTTTGRIVCSAPEDFDLAEIDLAEITRRGFLILDELTGPFNVRTGWRIQRARCVDCRFYGTNVQPDFWVE